MKRKKGIQVVQGDDRKWYLEGGEGIDVLRGPYPTRAEAREALRVARSKRS